MIAQATTLTLALSILAFLAGRATSTEASQEGEPREAGFPLATPGKFHRLLDPLQGTFTVEATFYVPDASPVSETGKMTNAWVLGGLVLKQAYEGGFMGVPLEGLGFLAYNDREGVYQSVWMDSMSNQISFETSGSISKDGQTLTFRGSEFNPVDGGEVPFLDVTVFEGKNKHTFTRSYVDDEGNKTPGMRIVYTRE